MQSKKLLFFCMPFTLNAMDFEKTSLQNYTYKTPNLWEYVSTENCYPMKYGLFRSLHQQLSQKYKDQKNHRIEEEYNGASQYDYILALKKKFAVSQKASNPKSNARVLKKIIQYAWNDDAEVTISKRDLAWLIAGAPREFFQSFATHGPLIFKVNGNWMSDGSCYGILRLNVTIEALIQHGFIHLNPEDKSLTIDKHWVKRLPWIASDLYTSEFERTFIPIVGAKDPVERVREYMQIVGCKVEVENSGCCSIN